MLEQSAQPNVTHDLTIVVGRDLVAIDELVVEALIIALAETMDGELLASPAQLALAEQDEMVEALGFYGEHKPLSMRIQVGRSWRKAHGLDVRSDADGNPPTSGPLRSTEYLDRSTMSDDSAPERWPPITGVSS